MGNFPEQELPPLVKSILEIADYSGVSMHLSSEYTRHCCGLAYSSKGFKNAALSAARKTTEFLYRISGAGEKKILMDTSPCTHHMKNYGEILDGEYLEKWKKLRIFDVIEFLHSEILPKVKIHPLDRRVTFHPVCSVKRMGLESRLIEIIQSCSNDVYIPPITGCCASAGDRGLHYPELSRSATAVESELLRKSGAEKYYSTSRTCEIGMSNAVDKPFESVVFLVRDAIEAAREKQA
jgi:D-lactate dehydrogenase